MADQTASIARGSKGLFPVRVREQIAGNPALIAIIEPLPDDAVLFDLLLVWAPDEKIRHRILVENPEVLYDYPKGP